MLLHNTGGAGNHFLNVKLVGAKSNRDAMGARIRVRAGGKTQVREIAGGGSYLSQSDLRARLRVGRQYSGGQRRDHMAERAEAGLARHGSGRFRDGQ